MTTSTNRSALLTQLVGVALAGVVLVLGATGCSEAKKSAPVVTHARDDREHGTTETVECAEVQIMPRFQGSEPVRRYRARPNAKLRLARSSTSYVLTAAAGASMGTSQPSNDYAPEERQVIPVERRVSFAASTYVVHCLSEHTD